MAIEWNPKNREKFRLSMLRYIHAAGFVDLLCWKIRSWAKDLKNSEPAEVREQFAWFEREAERCAAVEDEYGKGSLLNLDHPFIKRSVDDPSIVAPEHREAALRYRHVKEIAA